MVRKGLWVRLEAKPGKEDELEEFLKSALPLAEKEPATTDWFALRVGPSSFGIFDVFPDEQARKAHLSGMIASALMEKAPLLLSGSPVIEKLNVLASKFKHESPGRETGALGLL